MLSLGPLDIASMLWLFACWGGYALYARHTRAGTLMAAMHTHRLNWMENMLGRENRMVDANIMGTVMRSVGLFASTTIFIVGGLIAVLGSVDKARDVVNILPFTVEASTVVWEVKIVLMLLIYIYAFFKFAWALRQFNYSIIFVGAAPAHDSTDEAAKKDFAVRAARVVSLAVNSFNQGLRAYYFGLAALGWFIHPVVFAGAALFVVGVLYRREFRSRMLKALAGDGPVT